VVKALTLNARARARSKASVVLVAALSVVALAAAGVASGGAQRQTRPVADVGSITIGGVFCTCHLDMYVAWKKGFFAKRGVTVKDYVLTQGGSLTYTGVAAGTFDVGAATLETIVRGQAAGQQVKAVGDIYPEFWAFAVRNDLRSSLKKVTDLKGKTIGVSRIGSGSWAFLIGLLGKSGMSASDVNIVQLGDLNGVVSALKAKKVDASVIWEPGTSAALRSNVATPLINLQIPGVTGKLLGSNVSMSQVIAVKADLINNNPKLVQAVVDAVKDADAWLLAKNRKTSEIAQVLKQIAPGSISTGTLTASIKSVLKVQPKTPQLTREGYTTSTKLLLDTGALAKAVPFEDVVDCRFAGCGK
jgi:ABC-type nitrate/sulfonate/bicarbonate transport system substrate-binding protein